jgi:hypothetical protein
MLLVLTVGLLALCQFVAAAEDKSEAAKEALQKFNEFVGQWKGDAQAEKVSKLTDWKESLEWGWKFKGDDVWIVFNVKDGKFFKKGEVRFQDGKSPYKMTVTTTDDKELVFDGKFAKNRLIFTRTDADSGESQELALFIAGGGVYLNYEYSVKAKGTTVAKKYFVVKAKKEGESLAGGNKKPECIVSGGLGTIAVSYGGKTYYVCCSGCRDAFNENPEKYVKAAKK